MDGVDNGYLVGLGAFITSVCLALGGLWWKIQSGRSKLRKQEADIEEKRVETALLRERRESDANRKNSKEDRQDEIEQNWKLIKRMNDIIDGHSAQLASVRAELTKNIKDCEEREEVANQRIAKLERQNGRAIERLRMSEDQCRRYIKGYTMPPFREDEDGSSSTPALV